MEPKTSIVLIPVVYNNPAECVTYLQSVMAADLSSVALTVIVADNSRDNNQSCFDALSHPHMQLIYFHTGSNLGYMNAGNAAYERFIKDQVLFDLLIISNTDLLIEDVDFFKDLARKNAICSKDVLLLAPDVESSLTGRNLNPQLVNKPPKKYVDRIRFFYSSPLLYNALLCMSWMKHKYMSTPKPYVRDMPIYAPHGSIFIFRSAFFEKGGNVRFPFFLFGEEIYIAEQVKNINGKILYTPGISIVHNEHSSTGLFKWGRKFNAIRETGNHMKALYHY